MSLVAHYLHHWRLRLGILFLLGLLWPLQTLVIQTLQQHSFTPYSIRLSLPLDAKFAETNGISPTPLIDKVFITGNFSDWHVDDPFYQMHQNEQGQWQYDLPVYPGEIEYKLVLHLKDKPELVWLVDPNNPQIKHTSWGGENSLLIIPNWPKISIITQLLVVGLFGSFLIYCLLEPLLYWLLHLAIPFHRKLMLSNLLILFCAQLLFFGYQLHQSRQLIKEGLIDSIHGMHIMLAANNLDFNQLETQKTNIDNSLNKLFYPAVTRIEKSQSSLFQITLSDFAVLNNKGQIISLSHRAQNHELQQDRAAKLGFENSESYFTQGLWANLLPEAKLQALSGQLIVAKRPAAMCMVETDETNRAEWILGFSQFIQPIIIRGQLKGYYAGSIQVKLYGQELLNSLLFQLLLLAGIMALASGLLSKVGKIVTADILYLSKWTQKMVQGDLSQKITINSQDEIEQLAVNFESMRTKLIQSFTQIEEQNSSLYKEAYFNSLTGLSNRKKLFADMENQYIHAVVVFNINGFGQINDFYGVKTADGIIAETAKRLANSIVDPKMTLYKTSVDEFIITLSKICDANDIETFATAMIEQVSGHSMSIDQNEVFVNLTAGAAMITDAPKADLQRLADLARRQARLKMQRFLMFTQQMADPAEFQFNMQQTHLLALAVQHDWVVPYVQLIHPLQTNQLPKFECLMRIQQPNKTVLLPAGFMTIARKSGLYAQLMRSMLRQSIELFKGCEFEFSVNITLDDISTQESLQYIVDQLINEPDAAHRLTFELLESEEITNYDVIDHFIKTVKPFGCKIAIDDFGSGYSNFVHLLSLDIDFIKIDGSLIRDIDTDIKAHHLVSTLVGFAKKMNISTVAEFVHSASVLKKVQSFDIDYAQGYYLGKPMPSIEQALIKQLQPND